jgi:hypothetical protein
MPALFLSRPKATTGTIAAAIFLLSSSASFAIDASAVAERLKAFSAAQGQAFIYEAIENETADSFTLKGSKITIVDVPAIMVGNIALSGIRENADGSLVIDKVTYDQISLGDKEFTLTIDNAAADNYIIPAVNEPDALKNLVNYTGFAASNLKVIVNGNTVGTMAALNITNDPLTREKPMIFKAEMTGIAADFTSIEDPKFKQGLTQLGYGEKFTGKIAMDASWNANDGRMDIKTFDIHTDSVGTLGFALVVNGITAEFIKRLQDAEKVAMETKNPEASSMAMMQELPKLFLESATISFKDDSITKRILKFQSTMMGGSPDDVAKMVPVMIPMALAGLGNPNFTNMVAGAVGRFVGEPGNIKISAAPAKPLAFSEIMGIGMAAPQTLPDALGVKVTANE